MKFIASLIILLWLCDMAYTKELIVVGAKWCPYCTKQQEYIKNNPEVMKNFKYTYMDVDEHPELIHKLDIELYPSSFIFDDDNKKIGELNGFIPKNFKEWIKRYE